MKRPLYETAVFFLSWKSAYSASQYKYTTFGHFRMTNFDISKIPIWVDSPPYRVAFERKSKARAKRFGRKVSS
jgi:hypothetical protein